MPQRTCSLGDLAALVGGVIRGDSARVLHGVNGLAEAGPGEITFFNNPRYRQQAAATRASAVITDEASAAVVEGRDVLVVRDPYLAFARVSAFFHPRPTFSPGVDPRACIEPGATVDPSATVMAFCYVAPGATIGPRTVLFPSVFVGESASIGEDSLLYPHVVVREGCRVGARAILQPGAVIGGDGFGFAFDPEKPEHFKIPQAGTVEVQDDVEIGANSAVDRATHGRTVIGQGTKIDNLVQVGHNVQVGPLCILCGHVGLAGSSQLGPGVVCGGQVGVGNHVKIGARARVGAQSGVKDDLTEGAQVVGSPAIPLGEFARSYLAFQKGAETVRALHKLEKKVAELEAKLAELSRP